MKNVAFSRHFELHVDFRVTRVFSISGAQATYALCEQNCHAACTSVWRVLERLCGQQRDCSET